MSQTIEALEQATPIYDTKTRKRNDLETLYAECLEGRMRTPFEYSYDHITDVIYAEDGSNMDRVFDDAYEAICTQTEKNPNLAFEKRRSLLERGERDDMHAMLRGELPNVMVVVSDFPEELKEYPKDYAGYNVTRQQTMLRVIIRNGHKLKMYSQSLDGSNRQALESIYERFSVHPHEGELLGQRIHTAIDDPEETGILVDTLQGIYDRSMYEQTGKPHTAGIEVDSTKLDVETYSFVQSQVDLVQLAVEESLAGEYTEDVHYKTVAALQARFDEYRTIKTFHASYNQTKAIEYSRINNSDNFSVADLAMRSFLLQQERDSAGLLAAKEGRSFSGCGSTASSRDESIGGIQLGVTDQLKGLGYTTSDEKEEKAEDWDYDDVDFCVECQAPPEDGEGMKKVGPCKICEDCVNNKHGGKQ